MTKSKNKNLFIGSGIMLFLIAASFLVINTQVKAHTADDSGSGPDIGTEHLGCMGMDIDQEDFGKFHEEMWSLMEKYGMFDPDYKGENGNRAGLMNRQNSDNHENAKGRYNLMGMGLMMN